MVTSNRDIPGDIRAGFGCFALLGSDQYGELESPVEFNFDPVCRLDCSLVLAVPSESKMPGDVPITIATSYPNTLQSSACLLGLGEYKVLIRSGKTEGSVAAGLADAIFDIRETGASITANNLEITKATEPLWLGGFWLSQNNV